MEIKLLVGIPTINRADLLNEALQRYFEDFKNTEIFIIDNGNQEIITRENDFAIYRPVSNLNVSGSWNAIMDYADKRGATHVFMLNDDIVSGVREQKVIELINYSKKDFINSQLNWCAFILSVKAWKKVGKFEEEMFPNYFNDNDYYMRLKMHNIPMIWTNHLNPAIYRNSQTIAKDPTLNSKFTEYENNYIKKWGGLPIFEAFSTPFNQ